jgi:hypothetical protein
MISVSLIAAALLGGGQTSGPSISVPRETVAEFGMRGGRGGGGFRIIIESIDAPRGTTTKTYWATMEGNLLTQGTTDSHRCPALLTVLEGIRQIELPSPAAIWDMIHVADAPSYFLTVRSSYAPAHPTNLDTMTISVLGGPLADWVHEARRSLETC